MLPADTKLVQLCAQGMDDKEKGEAVGARLFFEQARPKAAPATGPNQWHAAAPVAAKDAATPAAQAEHG